MPTVIDSLTVELRLDTSQFERGRKEAGENLEQTKRKVEDQSRGVNDSLGKMSESFMGVAKAALEMYGVVLSTQAIKRFTEDTTRANASLGRLGQNLATSPAQIYAWGRAAERLGGSADATAQSFQSLGDQIEAFHTQNQQLPMAFYQLEAATGKQIDKNHGLTKSFVDIAEALHILYQTDPQKADFFGRQLGIDAGTVNLMERLGAGIGKISDQIATMAPTQEQIDRSQKLQESWAKLAAASDSFGRSLVDVITPALIAASDATANLLAQAAPERNRQLAMTPEQGAAARAANREKVWGAIGGAWHWLTGSGSGGPDSNLSLADRMRGGTPWSPNTQPDFPALSGGIPSTVEGRPVSRANPVPVTITDGGGQSGGGFWDTISSWFGGGSAPAAAPASGPRSPGAAPSAATGAAPSGQSFSYDAPPAGAPATLTDLISQEALKAAGGDAAKAAEIRQRMEGIRNGESGHTGRYDVNLTGGDRSYGPFQLNRIAPGALGSVFEQETAAERKRLGLGGLDDPRTIPLQTQWVAKYLAAGKSLAPWGGANWPLHPMREADPSWGNAGYDPGMMNLYQPPQSADGAG